MKCASCGGHNDHNYNKNRADMFMFLLQELGKEKAEAFCSIRCFLKKVEKIKEGTDGKSSHNITGCER